MNITLWIIQGVLAAAFGMAALMKTTQPREKLAKSLAWVEDVSDRTVRLIGAAEGAAAVGLILPAATGIAKQLTPLAACGIGLIMVLAIRVHMRRKEPSGIATNVVLLALAALVAWGRFGPYPS